MSMAPASVVGVVFLGPAGTGVVGLAIGPDRGHRSTIGGDMDPLRAPITGFLGATAKPAWARTRPRPSCVHLWLST